MKREEGSIGDLMAAGLCMLAMTVVMLSYLESARMIQQKTAAGQIARKYILRMETVGTLTDADRAALWGELEAAGITGITLDGTTTWQVDYGEPVALQIQGTLGSGYEFTEKRVSTAKH